MLQRNGRLSYEMRAPTGGDLLVDRFESGVAFQSFSPVTAYKQVTLIGRKPMAFEPLTGLVTYAVTK